LEFLYHEKIKPVNGFPGDRRGIHEGGFFSRVLNFFKQSEHIPWEKSIPDFFSLKYCSIETQTYSLSRR
jgi:hypothetical protein